MVLPLLFFKLRFTFFAGGFFVLFVVCYFCFFLGVLVSSLSFFGSCFFFFLFWWLFPAFLFSLVLEQLGCFLFLFPVSRKNLLLHVLLIVAKLLESVCVPCFPRWGSFSFSSTSSSSPFFFSSSSSFLFQLCLQVSFYECVKNTYVVKFALDFTAPVFMLDF